MFKGNAKGDKNKEGKGKGGSGKSSGQNAPRGDRAPTSEVPCRFLFMYGNCSKGHDCNYAHRSPEAEELKKFKWTKSGGSTPGSPGAIPIKDKPCFAHGQGICKFGADCIFSHDPAVLQSPRLQRGRPRPNPRARHVAKVPRPRRTVSDKRRGWEL